MKLIRKAGATSNILQIFIADSSSTTGGALTGLTNASSGLTAYYHKDTDTTATAISLVTMTVGTFTSSGFKEIDSTNMPGWYQFCPPDAAFSGSNKSVGFHLKGATNMAPLPIEIDLWAADPQDAVHFGLTCLPNTAVTTNASLLTSGTGTDQLSVTSGRIDIGKALGTAVTLDSNNVLNVSAKYLAGTALTGRDIGTSVLLSNGTGTGQVSLSSGAVTVGTNNDKTGYRLVYEARNGTAQAGASGSITLDSGASATDNLYRGAWVTITSGTGAAQTRQISGYTGSTKVATVAPSWAVNPDSTSVFAVLWNSGVDVEAWASTFLSAPATAGIPDVNVKNMNNVAATSITTINANQGTTQPVNFTGTGASALAKSDMVDIAGAAVSTSSAQIGVNIVNAGGTAWASGSLTSGVFASGAINAASINADSGLIIRANTATASASTTLTLDAGASATADYYKDCWLVITSGTGVGQSRRISTYSTGKVATVSPAWATTPASTATFAILPAGRVDVDAILGTASAGAAGSVGIDWAQVANPTTSVGLTGTTISTSQAIASVSGAVGSVTGSVGSVTGAVGSVTGSVGSVTGAVGSVTGSVGSVASGGITAASLAADTITAAKVAADVTDEIWAKACTEPTAVIGANPTAIQAMSWLATLSRNKITQTATSQVLKADDGSTTVATSTVSDDATTFTRGKFA